MPDKMVWLRDYIIGDPPTQYKKGRVFYPNGVQRDELIRRGLICHFEDCPKDITPFDPNEKAAEPEEEAVQRAPKIEASRPVAPKKRRPKKKAKAD